MGSSGSWWKSPPTGDGTFCTTRHIHTTPSPEHSSASPQQPGLCAEAYLKPLCDRGTTSSSCFSYPLSRCRVRSHKSSEDTLGTLWAPWGQEEG